MNPYAIGVFTSIVVYLIVGNYAGRKVKHLEDYFVAGRQAPTLLIVGTLVASFLSTSAFLAETGMAYAGYGVLLLIVTAINSIGYVIGALFFGRFLRRSRAITVAEYFGNRFNDHRIQLVAGLTIIVGLGAYLTAVTQGAALILSQITAIPYGGALLLAWAGYTMFTFYSGSRGVIITDTIMFLLFSVVAIVALGFIIDAAGGWHATITSLATYEPKPGIISWHGMVGPDANWQTVTEALTWALVFGIAWSVVVAVSPWQVSRYLMARNEHTVMRSACASGAAILALYIALMFAGAAVNLSNPNIEPNENTMIWAAMNLMPVFAGALFLAGIMAAALSSASTFLSLIGFSVSNDIVRQKTSDDQKRLRMSRYTMLVIGLVALIVSFLMPPKIFLLTYFAGTLFASSWGPVAFMSVWSNRITSTAAFWGMLTGFLGNVVPKSLSLMGVISLPVYLDPILIGAVLSLVVILIVSRFGQVSDGEKEFRQKIHVTPQAEINAKEFARTMRWPKLLFAAGIVTTIGLIIYYVGPYTAANQSAPDGINGEYLFAIAYGAMFIVSGTLAYFGIKKSYGPAP
jgi:sodium/pantothenate symporter